MVRQRHTPSALSECRDIVPVSSKPCDVFPDPLESGPLVVEPEIEGWLVERCCFVNQVLACKEALPVNAVAACCVSAIVFIQG